MTEYNPIDCEFLLEGKSCGAIVKDAEGKTTREKWCLLASKYDCCYLCIFQESCDISCRYMSGPTNSQDRSRPLTGGEQKRERVLRGQILDMISKKARLGFLITESDCAPQERLEIINVIEMLRKLDVMRRDIDRAKRKEFFVETESERKAWLSEVHELENKSAKLMDDMDKKISVMADSISAVLTSKHIDFQELISALKNKGIILEKLECPHCGSLLQISDVPKKEEVLKCKYCGSSILAFNLYEKFKGILKPQPCDE